MESRLNLFITQVGQQLGDLEQRMVSALKTIEERHEQLRAAIEDLRAQQEHMCGSSTDLVRARRYILDEMKLCGRAWVDVSGMIKIRGSAAAKLIANKIDDRIRSIYRDGMRPTLQQIVDLLHDSAFMASLRADYIQIVSVIKTDVARS